MKSFFLIISMLISFSVKADDIFSNKMLSNFYMNPKKDAPIIYPVELGKKMILKIQTISGIMFLMLELDLWVGY